MARKRSRVLCFLVQLLARCGSISTYILCECSAYVYLRIYLCIRIDDETFRNVIKTTMKRRQECKAFDDNNAQPRCSHSTPEKRSLRWWNGNNFKDHMKHEINGVAFFMHGFSRACTCAFCEDIAMVRYVQKIFFVAIARVPNTNAIELLKRDQSFALLEPTTPTT